MRTVGVVLLGVALAVVPASTNAGSSQVATEHGAIEASCNLGSPGISDSYGFDSLFAATIRGDIYVVGSSRAQGEELTVVLRGEGADCRPARQFGDDGAVTLTVHVSSSFGEIDTMATTPDGDLLLGGSDGSAELLGRLRPDGMLDTSFGSSGWERLRPRENVVETGIPVAPIITSITEAPSGLIYTGGDDQAAHCCVSDFVGAVRPDGELDQQFGQGGWVDFPTLQGSYTTDLVYDIGVGVLVLGQYLGMGEGMPTVFLLSDRGILDRQFDLNVADTIKALNPNGFQFAPTMFLRTRGAFGLIGDIGNEIPGRPGKSQSLVAGLTSKGMIDPTFGSDGRTYFPFQNAANLEWNTAGSGHSLVLVSEPASSRSESLTLNVLDFSQRGVLNRTFGESGIAKLNIAFAANVDVEVGVAAVTGANGEVAVVVASARDTRLWLLRS